MNNTTTTKQLRPFHQETNMTKIQLNTWHADRRRQAAQHPISTVRSRGDHYRRKNTGIALRTYRAIKDHN